MANIITKFLRAIEERNEIERAKLELEREAFEFNKRELANNNMYFKQEIDRLKESSNVTVTFDDGK